MIRFNLFKRSIPALLGVSVLMVVTGCAQTPSPLSWAVITDLPEWAPGRPQVYRQVAYGSDGVVQDAVVRDQTVQSLVEFSQAPGTAAVFPLDAYFPLQNRYDTPVQPGLIVEGRGNRTNFYFRQAADSKFISGENALLPAELQKLRAQLPAKKDPGRTGTFIQVRVYDEVTQGYLRQSGARALTPEIVREFEPLERALKAPFRFVDFKPEQVQALAARLSLRNPPFTVTMPGGEVIRLEYFN